MRNKFLQLTIALLALIAGSHAALAQGTAFTYQGELTDGESPANGTYVFGGTLYDAATNGTKVRSAGSATVPVSNGRFTMTLDPGADVFTGAPRWLEINVRTNAVALPITLRPRQLITTTPYAAFAAGASAAGLSGTIPAANIASGTITSHLLATGAVAADQLAGGAVTANKLGADVGLWSVNGGAVFRSGGGVGIGVMDPTAALHLNGGMKINGANTLEFGAGVAGKELSAGKIGYQTFGPGALDIVGAGTNVSGRQIRFWAEGGAQFMGPVAGNFTGNGAGLTGLSPANITGVLAPAQIPSLDAGKITGGTLNTAQLPTLDAATKLTGTLADARLSANVPLLNGANVFTGANTFSQPVTINAEVTARVVTITGGSDVAEPYHVAGTRDIEPVSGMVVSIDPDKIGQMRVASRAHDKTVAGILSGANGIAPGITLRQAGTIADGLLPVASIGRVWCYGDADANGPIEAGDMLTTSDTPGHAMKVTDFVQANGSVIGKAMSPLRSGRGLVLVFVSLK